MAIFGMPHNKVFDYDAWTTRFGGIVRETENGKYMFVVPPRASDYPLKATDSVPENWEILPIKLSPHLIKTGVIINSKHMWFHSMGHLGLDLYSPFFHTCNMLRLANKWVDTTYPIEFEGQKREFYLYGLNNQTLIQYCPHFKEILDYSIKPKMPIFLHNALNGVVGAPNVWLDIQYGVLWTINQEKFTQLKSAFMKSC